MISKLAGMTKMLHGKLSLTAKGTTLLKSPSKLLILFTETFFLRFAWSYFDIFESKQAAQFGAGYTLVLLGKYGHHENFWRLSLWWQMSLNPDFHVARKKFLATAMLPALFTVD
jgi:hypothetical protein